MTKIGIIGIGHVGSTTAYTLIQQKAADELVLFDKNETLVNAEVHDLTQGQIGHQSSVKIRGNALDELGTCDLIIFCAGDITILRGTTDRFAELEYTKTVVEEWGPKIKASGFNGVLLTITNPCDVIARYLQELTGLPRNQVLGTGTALDTARMQQAVAEEFQVHPNNVAGYVLGEHGEAQFTAWTTVSVGNENLTEKFGEKKLDILEDNARDGGWVIFAGKFYTSYGIANQAVKLANGILTDSHMISAVSAYSEKEKIYIGHPAMIGKKGIIRDYTFELSVKEQGKWTEAVEKINEMYATIGHPAHSAL